MTPETDRCRWPWWDQLPGRALGEHPGGLVKRPVGSFWAEFGEGAIGVHIVWDRVPGAELAPRPA